MFRGSHSTSSALIVALLGAITTPAASQATKAAVRATPVLRVDAPSQFDASRFSDLRYRMIGPARGGRVTTVTGVPSEPRTFYFGSTGGGVWKSTNAGVSWTNVSDGQIGVGSIGAVEVSLSDPRIVYVGTGSDGIRSNVSIGRGVWRSADAGKSWLFAGLRDVGQIGGVRVHPTNHDLVYVAALGNPFKPTADRGVYRTRDGGRNWQKILFVSDSTGAADIEFQPGNPNVLYASMWRGERKPWTIISGAREGGIYKSTDGGDTWQKLGGGLPAELFGKSNVAVSAASPNRVYALIEAKPGSGLYRSDDAGSTWSLVNTQGALVQRPFYYTTITADPTNADVVYAGAEGYFKSTDGGKTFRAMSTPHGDNHDMWVNPRDGNVLIQSNDGGANVSLDGGRTWSTQYNQPTSEIYQVYVDEQFPYRVYGAQQDNSTLILPSLPTSSGRPDDPIQGWRTGPGCETGPIIPHLTNPDTVYGSCKGQFSRMSLRTGQEKQYWVGAQSLYGNAGKDLIFRFQRVSPMEVSPHDARVVYYGSQYLHRTRDEGVTWEKISPDLTANDPRYQGVVSGEPITVDVTGEETYSTLYAIRESPITKGLIWTGANDGPVHVTRDNGRTWTNVTPKDLPPGGRIQNIEPSPHRPGTAYIAAYRYLLGDFEPYIYRTDDYGQSWTRLTDGKNGIAIDEPTRVVREDPSRAGLLYAGTEFGMYVSFDNGKRWAPLQLNLPATPITDIKVHHKDLVLSTQGRAFWILDDLAPLHQLSDAVMSANSYLFAPRDAYRFRYAGTFGGVESTREGSDAPQYLPSGAVIDYWIGAPSQSVTIDVADAQGKVLRRFTTGGEGERVQPAEQGMRRPSVELVGSPRLTGTSGFHRMIWDLTLPGPWDPSAPRRGRGGPTVAPGTYTVRLTADGKTTTRPLVIKPDPRVARDGVSAADLREQLAHNLRVRDMVSEVNELVARVQSAKKTATGANAQRLAALEATLVTPPVRYSKPGLQAHIQYLYGLTTQADQKVGRDAIERYGVLRKQLDAAQARAVVQ